MTDNRSTLDISWWAIAKVLLVIIGLWLLWQIRSVILLAFFVVVIVAAFAPVVDRWSQKIHRGLSVALLYLVFIFVLGLVGVIIIPPLASQIQELALGLPFLLERFSAFIGSQNTRELTLSSQLLEQLSKGLTQLGSSLVSTTKSVIDGVVAVVTILVLSFYLLLEQHGGRQLVTDLLPMENREKIASLLQKIGLKMGAWLRGQLTLGVIIGLISYVVLLLVGVPYALTLAVWAGVTELIPYIGPVLGAIPAVIVAFTVSPLKGFIVLVAYVLVQQLEANLLVPKVMGKAVGLSPVVIIFAILIGAQLAGLLGVVIAVPVAAAISVLIQEWRSLYKKI